MAQLDSPDSIPSKPARHHRAPMVGWLLLLVALLGFGVLWFFVTGGTAT